MARTAPTALVKNANTRCGGRYHLPALSAAWASRCSTRRETTTANHPVSWRMTRATVGDHAICLVLLQDIFRSRPFNLALRRSRTARFVEVNMGITPRNVRSEGVAPCK